jgi:hypothetical protein
VPATDAEGVRERHLRSDLVANRDEREPASPRTPGRVRGRRPGAALAATEDVARDDEQLVGVERCPGTDQPGPPPRRGVARAGVADDVAVAGEGVLDEDGVVT